MLIVNTAELVAAGAAALDATGSLQIATLHLFASFSHLFAVALHDVKKMYNAAKAKLGELKAKIASQSAAAAPSPQQPPPLLLVAAKSFAASHSLPTLQPDDPNSFFAAIEALISVLERNLADAKSQAATAQNALKTPPQSPPSQVSGMIDAVREDSVGRGLSRLSISPIAGGVNAERESGNNAVVTTFASVNGSGAFTSPKKAALKPTSADPASSIAPSSSSMSTTSAVSAATTAAAIDSESVARIQLHNIDLQRRVERLQMSMKVAANLATIFFFISIHAMLAAEPRERLCRGHSGERRLHTQFEARIN